MKVTETHIFGETFLLHPFRAMYWQREKMLLLSDLHLGKVAHFRNHGIPVPQASSDANWDKLISLLLDFQPERVLFLGDLFHSDFNVEWDDFCHLTAQFSNISFELVPGNHDILFAGHYEEARLVLHPPTLEMAPFLFSHIPLETISGDRYNLAGHIHPSVCLRGYGRQTMRLPCFYFADNQGILPAFGAFTGTADVEVKNGDRVFVIASDEVLALA